MAHGDVTPYYHHHHHHHHHYAGASQAVVQVLF